MPYNDARWKLVRVQTILAGYGRDTRPWLFALLNDRLFSPGDHRRRLRADVMISTGPIPSLWLSSYIYSYNSFPPSRCPVKSGAIPQDHRENSEDYPDRYNLYRLNDKRTKFLADLFGMSQDLNSTNNKDVPKIGKIICATKGWSYPYWSI